MTDHRMDPFTGEEVEVDGIYCDDWGKERAFRRGEQFPADTTLGATGWQLISYAIDDHPKGQHVDPRFRASSPEAKHKQDSPRLHVERGDR